MEKLKLSIAERFALTNLLSEIYKAGGLDLKSLKKAMNAVAKVEITQKEAEKIELKQEGVSVTWQPAKAKDIDVEFSVDEIGLVREAIKAKNESKSFTLADRNILSLAEKLEIEL